VPGDTNGTWDIFVRDRRAGTVERVSVSSSGRQGNDESRDCRVSDDGRYVVFMSVASNLVTGDTNFAQDHFLRDRLLETTRRVNVSSSGTQANNDARSNLAYPSISGDGRVVGFTTLATNLVANDSNTLIDAYAHQWSGELPGAGRFTLKPQAGLSFGAVAVASTSTLRMWLQNRGDAPLAIASIGLRGADASQFSLRHFCGSAVAPDDACLIDVTFAPTSTGGKTARLRVVAGDESVRIRDLEGTAIR
jgi:hypothetical protein